MKEFPALELSTIYLVRRWNESGMFWHRQWENVVGLFGDNGFLISVLGTWTFTTGIFWFLAGLFTVVDVTGQPWFLLPFKVQPNKNCPVTLRDLRKVVHVALLNQTLVGMPFIIALYYSMMWRGCSWSSEGFPSAARVFLEIAASILIEEAGFYYSHRLFHHPVMYKRYHKKHHEWTAPLSIVAIYAHPLEHLLANLLPLALGPVLLGAHLFTTWLFWGLATTTTIVHHSGYHLPFLPSPQAHDYHHLKFNANYGAIGLLDRLHGTDAMFRRSVSFKRHFLLMSSRPVSKQFPGSS